MMDENLIKTSISADSGKFISFKYLTYRNNILCVASFENSANLYSLSIYQYFHYHVPHRQQPKLTILQIDPNIKAFLMMILVLHDHQQWFDGKLEYSLKY